MSKDSGSRLSTIRFAVSEPFVVSAYAALCVRGPVATHFYKKLACLQAGYYEQTLCLLLLLETCALKQSIDPHGYWWKGTGMLMRVISCAGGHTADADGKQGADP